VAGQANPFEKINRGALWTAAGDVVDIGLPSKATSMRPTAINNVGEVVGVAR
jgi:hypothetical protein